MKKNLAIILAGGSGSRIKQDLPKQFLMLGDKTILQKSIEAFENHPAITHIFLVIHEEYVHKAGELVQAGGYKKVLNILPGGPARQDSSRIGVMAAPPYEYENILIHDAARPFVTKKIIDDILDALETFSAVNVAIPSADTIIEIDDKNRVKKIPDRKYLRRVQTPQAFKSELIRRAHLLAQEKGITNATDDCGLVLELDLAEIVVVEGSPANIKITYPEDILIAERMIANER